MRSIRATPTNDRLVSRAHVLIKVHRFVHLVSLYLFVIEPALEKFGVVLCKDLVTLLYLTELELKGVDLIMKNLTKRYDGRRRRQEIRRLLVPFGPSPPLARCVGRPFVVDGRFLLVLCEGSLIQCEKVLLSREESRSLLEGVGHSGPASCTPRQVRPGGRISETRGTPCKLRGRGSCTGEDMS